MVERRPLGHRGCVGTSTAIVLAGLAALAGMLPSATVAAADPVTVSNYSDGAEVRFPVPLLRGHLADASLTAVAVENTSSTRPSRTLTGLALAGRFVALTELVPGENHLLLRAGTATQALRLTYRPQTNPYVVRVAYWTDSTGDTTFQSPDPKDPQDWHGKLDTAMKLMQTFTAERLCDAGFGRLTFNLELDADGRAMVHCLRGDKRRTEYEAMDGGQLYTEAVHAVTRELPAAAPGTTVKTLVIPAFTRFDPGSGKALAHTALGGGDLALFGGGDLFTWPDRLAQVQPAFMNATRVDPALWFSDSVGRHTYWAIAATTMGAALHELGHTFGLPHSREPHDIMTRGHDRLNRVFTLVEPPHAGRTDDYAFRDDEVATWAPVSAYALAASRHFALDSRQWPAGPAATGSSVRLDLPGRRLVITASAGLRHVGVDLVTPQEGIQALYALPLDRTAATRAEVDIPLAELGRRVGSAVVNLRVSDGDGVITTTALADLLRGPFVQAWQFAPEPAAWPQTGQFVAVTTARLEALEAAAGAAALVRASRPFVDFHRVYAGSRENVAGYAFRRLRTPTARQVRLLTGSDDALRVWLNGRAITEVLALRSARVDAEATLLDLAAGENRLLVEVSQALGGWGLYLRLEDAHGERLELTDGSELLPVTAAALAEAEALVRGPFVRDWQFATATVPWPDRSRFPDLPAARLSEIASAVAAAPLTPGSQASAFVNFRAQLPAPSTNVAGYAGRTLRAAARREVRILTGSDDALRLWLNGQLLRSVLALRSAQPDAETTPAVLEPGENQLLIEVDQGAGDWGLYLRLTDADGADLLVGADGTLTRVEPTAVTLQGTP